MARSIILVIVLNLTIAYTKAQSSNNENTGINEYLKKVRGIDDLIHNRDRTVVANQWREIISINPTDGEMWYRYGESLYLNNEPLKAVGAFKNAMRIGAVSIAPPDCAYYIAKCYAKQKDENQALNWLQRSFDMGYRYLSAPPKDSVFFPYVNSERFKTIIGIPIHEFKTRDEGWRFDLQLMVREIRRKRIDPYKSISKERLDSVANVLYTKIPSLTDIQVTLELMKIMRLVNDGHTMIYAFYERPELLKNLPFNMFFFKEGLYITEADVRYKDLLGCEITAFDDKTIPEIMQGMDPILNRDNECGPKVMGIFRMRTLPLLYGLGLIKSPDQVTITVKDTSRNTRKITISADSPIPTRKLWDKLPDSWTSYYAAKNLTPPGYLQKQFEPYWFQYLKNKQTVYFQYNRISSEDIPFEHFCDSLFDFIYSNQVDRLVIDLRLNNGGNTRLVPYLLDKIIASAKINRAGHLFVITGRRTFSAAQNFASLAERFTQTVFIGEPTGSSPNFIGEENPFELPYSKLMANVSDQYWQSSWPSDTREWTTPFFYIEPSFKDFAAGRDPDLEAILSYGALEKQ